MDLTLDWFDFGKWCRHLDISTCSHDSTDIICVTIWQTEFEKFAQQCQWHWDFWLHFEIAKFRIFWKNPKCTHHGSNHISGNTWAFLLIFGRFLPVYQLGRTPCRFGVCSNIPRDNSLSRWHTSVKMSILTEKWTFSMMSGNHPSQIQADLWEYLVVTPVTEFSSHHSDWI